MPNFEEDLCDKDEKTLKKIKDCAKEAKALKRHFKKCWNQKKKMIQCFLRKLPLEWH